MDSDGINDDARAELISRLFAMLTARFEDAAALAAEGQGKHSDDRLGEIAMLLVGVSDDVMTLARAVGAVLEGRAR
jgi:hypothetical protein